MGLWWACGPRRFAALFYWGGLARKDATVGKIPQHLRETIAGNIRECRCKKFPGHGGGTKCAKAFGVSLQQWSPWESGKRVPDELRLEQIAKFFGVSVEFMRRDHTAKPAEAMPPCDQSSLVPADSSPIPTQPDGDAPRQPPPPVSETPSPCPSPSSRCPFCRQSQPEQPFPDDERSLCRLVEHFLGELLTRGLPIRLSRGDIEILAAVLPRS